MSNWLNLIVIVVTLLGGVFYTLQPTSFHTQPLQQLRIGVLPDESPSVLKAHFEPLMQYLSEQVQLPTQLLIPEDYQELLELFQQGRIDLAYFGGATFVTAMQAYGARPLVMRNKDTHFTTSFIVRADSDYQSVEQLEGTRCSFGSTLSTSGHVMPRQFLLSEFGITPEKYFSDVHFSGAHDQTAYNVRDGISDVGAVNSVVLDDMLSDGRLSPNEVRIIWRTPPFANYVWGLPAKFDQNLSTKLRNAFLGLDEHLLTDSHILKQLSAQYFVPAGRFDFASLAHSWKLNTTLSYKE
jgi:phosphonate transport system substrate-binding protein